MAVYGEGYVDSVQQLVDGLRDGDERAAKALWDQYFPQLCRLAGQQLSADRKLADEEDVALSAIASFCKAAQQGRFPDLTDRQGLWRLLSEMTRRKSIDLIRHGVRQKRGGGKVGGESRLEDASPNQGSQQQGMAQFPGDDLTPSLCLILQEQARRLLADLQDPLLQQLVLLKLEGYRNREIADKLQCSLATVERRLQLARRKWQAKMPP